MTSQIFVRAKPSEIKITETYQYQVTISGTQFVEEKGEHPEGEIVVELPYDGFEYFTRPAYADLLAQIEPTSNELFASIGHLAISNIDANEFWSDEPDPPTRHVLHLQVPVPGDTDNLGFLLKDQLKAVIRYSYKPKWPDVHPRPHPLKLEIDILDEKTLADRFGDFSDPSKWQDLSQELSFERSLFFGFKIELALPEFFKDKPLPEMRLLRMVWPIATSYHMLELGIEVEDENEVDTLDEDENEVDIPEEDGNGVDVPEEDKKVVDVPDLFYLAEEGSIEWREVEFISRAFPTDKYAKEALILCRAPVMILKVKDPGELYQKKKLACRLEIEIPDALLSGMEAAYFTATGKLHPGVTIKKSTIISADVEIHLEERFDRKVLSPLQQLYFEGVILNEQRVSDIARLLRDLGFNLYSYTDKADNKEKLFFHNKKSSHPDYGLKAEKQEGPDCMLVMIHALGKERETRREKVIRGGETYTTLLGTGNTRLDMRAELSGDVRKLSQMLNAFHIKLKDLFYHAVDLG